MIKREALASAVALLFCLSASGTSHSRDNPQSEAKTESQSESAKRARQLMALVQSQDANRAAKIRQALSDDDWYLRGEAALALSLLKDQAMLKDAIPDLARLIKDQSWFV